MTASTEAALEAREAYGRRDWITAYDRFSEARRAGELCGDDLYAMSDAAWWMGDNSAVLDACEQAYQRYLQEDNPRRAAAAATDLAMVGFLRNDETLGMGWLGRAQRLLESETGSLEHGYLVYLLEVEGPLGGITSKESAAVDVIDAARRVQQVGRAHDDPTLMTAGILGEGRALVKVGRVAEGLGLLDEVMVTLRADALNPVWAGNLYCHLMSAAYELSDIRRGREWTAATTRWLSTLPVAVIFNGICRVHRSQFHQITGDWAIAEQEAEQVCRDLADLHTATTAEAHYQVGEIRRLRGDLQAAERAYGAAHEFGRDPQPGLALLRLAEGRTDAAVASIRAALLAEQAPLLRARLRAAHVEIMLATGALEEAREAAGELEAIAQSYDSSGLEVTARHARGSVLLAEGSFDRALPVLRDACRRWTEVEAPYDCARVRTLLARAYRALGDDDAAQRELDVAEAVYRRLGAARDLEHLQAIRTADSRPAGLSGREVEVLGLVASGATNRQIAAQLVISEKTVARHLSNIFAKLGVSSRTAAASFAFEHGIASR